MRRLKTLDRCKVATSICDPVSTGHDFPSFPISLSLGECACADWEIALDTVFQRIFQQSAMQSLVQASTLGKLALLRGMMATYPRNVVKDLLNGVVEYTMYLCKLSEDVHQR